MLAMGEPFSKVESLVSLWRAMPTSIGMIEQGHKHGKILLREHVQLQERLLRARSFILQSQTLLALSAYQKQRATLEKTLAKQDKQHFKIDGLAL